MKPRMLTAFLLAAPLLVAAQVDGFAYKGAPLRAPLAIFTEKVPLFQCSGDRCVFNRGDCQGSSNGILNKAVFDLYVQRGNDCRVGTSFGEALVLSGIVTFNGQGMAEVDLTVPTQQMDQLAEAVEAKFGKPTKSDSLPVKNGVGNEFPSWRKTWENAGDVLTLELRSGRVDDGRVLLMTRERLNDLQTTRRKKAEAGAKDL